MTGKALQMVRVAQRPHELARQAFPTLATDLARALRLGGGVCVGVHGGAAEGVVAVQWREGVVRRQGVLVGAAPGEAVTARVVVLLRGTLAAFHGRLSIVRCAHVQVRCAELWRLRARR